MRLLTLLFLSSVWIGLVGAEEITLCDIAQSSSDKAVQLRGLDKLSEVPCEVMNRLEIDRLFAKLERENPKYKEEKKKERYANSLYVHLGMLTPKQLKAIEELEKEKPKISYQAMVTGGLYLWTTKSVVMSNWVSAMKQRPVAVHEMTHVLQDQHFDLRTLMEREQLIEFVELLARRALVEGDAMATMIDFERSQFGLGSIAEEHDPPEEAIFRIVSASFVPPNSKASKAYLRFQQFPYSEGTMFVHSLLKEGGFDLVNRAYREPPASTEEILHPEKYLRQRWDFEVIPVESLRRYLPEGNWTLDYSTVLGELGISLILNRTASDPIQAVNAAQGWGGDTAALFRDSKGRTAVVWKTAWDSLDDFKQFAGVFIDGLKNRFQSGGTVRKGGRLWKKNGKVYRAFFQKRNVLFTVVDS